MIRIFRQKIVKKFNFLIFKTKKIMIIIIIIIIIIKIFNKILILIEFRITELKLNLLITKDVNMLNINFLNN